MGIVVAATHLDLLEPRALKFLLATALEDGEAIERFLREARASSRLRSEHIAHVFDVGRLSDGTPYMVMEYLEGADLGVTLRKSGALPVETAVLYVLQAMDALAEAHASGIIHRDLKPANLFLTFRSDGMPSVKVLDFGISKITGGPQDMEVTKTHAVLGSPHYMSPEQMHSSRDVDPRADVWSLGVILYQLMTGKLPFRGRSVTEVVTVVLSGPPAPPSSLALHIPPALDAVILRCLERDPSARFQSVADLAMALAPFAPQVAAFSIDRIRRTLGAAWPASMPPGTDQAVTPMPVSTRAAPNSYRPNLTASGMLQAPQIPLAPRLPGALAPTNASATPVQATLPFTPSPYAAKNIPAAPTSAPGFTPSPYSTGQNMPAAPTSAPGFTPSPYSTGQNQPAPSPYGPPRFDTQTGLPLVNQPGSATGAWGHTAVETRPSGSRRTALVGASAVGVLVLGIIALMVFHSEKPAATSQATSAKGPEATVTDPVVVPATAIATTSATASAPAPATASASASASASKKTPKYSDPFGMERK